MQTKNIRKKSSNETLAHRRGNTLILAGFISIYVIMNISLGKKYITSSNLYKKDKNWEMNEMQKE